jgi:D-serine deaminase-like pyridoxal phosphate-dependent protein
MMEESWYPAGNMDEFDTPALLLYPVRIRENIRRLLEIADPKLLRPHVKTNKIAEVSAMMMQAGIKKFKAASIAEAEMLAMIQAPDVLLGYPPTVPKIKRLIRLIQKYPDTKFSCLVDHASTALSLCYLFEKLNLTADIYIDLNVGMNRTGIVPELAVDLYKKIASLTSLNFLGLHAYDGHIKDHDLIRRTENCTRAFASVVELKSELEKMAGRPIILIAGGSPTSFIHAAAADREYSPGTFIFWDKGYSENLTEQPFEWAALLACRVISIPAKGKICVDLGYKSVASENPLPRVYFLNAPDAIPTAHSEEHLVLNVTDEMKFKPGDILYGVPWHICPTVALYDKAYIVENNWISGFWNVIARKREITI